MSKTVKQSIKVFHLDDDIRSVNTLKKILASFEEVEYLGGETGAKEAVEKIKQLKPDILFCDIVLKEHDGFWVAEQLKDFNCAIVYVSGHSEFAIKAFSACALHYMMKPALTKDIEEVLERYNKFYAYDRSFQFEKIMEVFGGYLNKTEIPRRIFVNNVEITHVIDIDKLMYAKAEGSYTVFTIQGADKILSSKNIKIYDDALGNHPDIMRVHRSVLVNKRYVKAIVRKKHLAFLLLENDEEIEISLYRKEEVLRKLDS